MKSWKNILLAIGYFILAITFSELIYLISTESHDSPTAHIIIDSEEYHDIQGSSIPEQLIHRIQAQPFNLASFIIFVCAIVHIFLSHQFHILSEKARAKNRRAGLEHVDTFYVEFMRFMGEIEVIFGLWIIPLMMAMSYFYDWNTAVHYLNGLNYTEPLFLVVILTLAATRPIMQLVEDLVRRVAKLGGGSIRAWWFSILTLGPILGSFITEPAAMTVSALLLGRQFYRHNPSHKLAYATLGLLFVNVSVGGVLTNFAAPPVLMIVNAWDWDTSFMIANFGLKSIVGILISNTLYLFYFRNDFKELEAKTKLQAPEEEESFPKTPFGIALIHIIFLAWVVVHLHYPVVFIGTFLLFLGFHQATKPYQDEIVLKTPVMVGFFLAGLIVHGNLQGWWISALLSHASDTVLLLTSMALTAFNDNAEITFLATLIPTFTDSMKYAVVAGAVAGGGLTVIANAPNLAGQTLLNPYFRTGISALYLFLGALIPTIIMATCFFITKVT